jgi:hypothetical protein
LLPYTKLVFETIWYEISVACLTHLSVVMSVQYPINFIFVLINLYLLLYYKSDSPSPFTTLFALNMLFAVTVMVFALFPVYSCYTVLQFCSN